MSNYLFHAVRTDGCDYDEYDALLLCGPTFAWVRDHIEAHLTWASGRTTYYGFTEKNYIVTVVGSALDSTEQGLVIASFNAG